MVLILSIIYTDYIQQYELFSSYCLYGHLGTLSGTRRLSQLRFKAIVTTNKTAVCFTGK